MGSGIDAARAEAPEHAKVMDNFKDQLLVALLKRLGPRVTIPISEVDATGDSVVSMAINQETRAFEFVVGRKS